MKMSGPSRPDAVYHTTKIYGLLPWNPPDIDIDSGIQKGFDRLHVTFSEQNGW
jgi:hypothetical protein